MVRAVLAVVVCLVVYFLMPLEGDAWGPVVVRAVVAIALLIGAIALQTLAVVRSGTPTLKAVESLSVSVVLVLVVAAGAYLSISTTSPDSFTEELDHIGALYLAMMTLTTVGFGDIGALSHVARIAVMVQMVLNVVVLGVAAKVVLGVARRGGARYLDSR